LPINFLIGLAVFAMGCCGSSAPSRIQNEDPPEPEEEGNFFHRLLDMEVPENSEVRNFWVNPIGTPNGDSVEAEE
jgi:hypothetical protein